MNGRPIDPTRARRDTGHRPMPGEAKVIQINALATAAPEPPDDIPEEAQSIWRVAMGELVHRGLREPDLEAIRQMCVAAARAREAGRYIERYGMVVQGRAGPMVNPLLKEERQYTREYLRLAEQYGLTFASRLRLGLMQLAGESILQTLDQDLNEAMPLELEAKKRAPAKKAAKKATKKAAKKPPAKKK